MQNTLIEENIIITEPSKNLRALGRNALAGKWKIAIIAMLIYTVCMTLPTLVFDSLFGLNVGNYLADDGYTYGIDANFYSELYNTMPTTSLLSSIYILLVTGPLALGVTLFFLALFRRHKVAPVDIFLGFEHFGKALGLMLFQTLFILLWTLLFIIPGVIASIRYSQAFFILADDPSKGIRQCMNESKAMMKGNKMKFFILGLSFIGWIFLSALPASILQNIGMIISSNAFVIALFAFVGSLFSAPVMAYMLSTEAGFYEILAGHLIKDTQPIPVADEVVAIPQPEESDDLEDKAEAFAEETADAAEETVDAAEETADAAGDAAEEVPQTYHAVDAPAEDIVVDETPIDTAEEVAADAETAADETEDIVNDVVNDDEVKDE